MPNDITKLPKWAQTLIQNRDAHIVRLQARVSELVALRNDSGPIDTDTFIDHMDNQGDESVRFQRLPRSARIVFWPGEAFPGLQLGVLTANWEGRENVLRVSSSGRGRLVVSPYAGNVVHIREIPDVR